MRKKFTTIIAAAMAMFMLAGSAQCAFAQGSSGAKGAGVIAAAAAAEQEAEAASQESGTAGSADTGESEDTAGDMLQGAETPELSTGQSFGESGNEADAEPAEYDLSDYENNEVLVMDQEGNVTLQTFDSEEALKDGLDVLAQDDSVALYQPNFTYESEAVSVSITDDSYSKDQWALENNGSFTGYRTRLAALKNADVDAEKTWKYYTPKRDVIIALVDTGVQTDHTELKGSFWVNEDEIPGNGKDDDGNGYVDDVNGWNFFNSSNKVYTGSTDAHGTHCAGTISAAKDNGEGISGLADYDNVKIMTLKALGGTEGSGTTLSLTRAIKYAEDNGASICNLSLGTETNDRLLYQTMKKSAMLFVVAAGNGNSAGTGIDIDKRPSYPASYDLDNIITVGNMKADGTLHESSDYGAVSVDLAAPGTDIISTAVNGKYSYMTGTSMAAPFVSAAAALVYSCNEELTLADTRQILLDTVKIDTAMKGKVATGGILDCGSAVAFAVTGDTQDEAGAGDAGDAGNASGTPSTGNTQTPSAQKPSGSQTQPQRNFGSSPFEGIPFPSGGLSVWTGWGGWNIRMEIPQFYRIIMGMSLGSA